MIKGARDEKKEILKPMYVHDHESQDHVYSGAVRAANE